MSEPNLKHTPSELEKQLIRATADLFDSIQPGIRFQFASEEPAEQEAVAELNATINTVMGWEEQPATSLIEIDTITHEPNLIEPRSLGDAFLPGEIDELAYRAYAEQMGPFDEETESSEDADLIARAIESDAASMTRSFYAINAEQDEDTLGIGAPPDPQAKPQRQVLTGQVTHKLRRLTQAEVLALPKMQMVNGQPTDPLYYVKLYRTYRDHRHLEWQGQSALLTARHELRRGPNKGQDVLGFITPAAHPWAEGDHQDVQSDGSVLVEDYEMEIYALSEDEAPAAPAAQPTRRQLTREEVLALPAQSAFVNDHVTYYAEVYGSKLNQPDRLLWEGETTLYVSRSRRDNSLLRIAPNAYPKFPQDGYFDVTKGGVILVELENRGFIMKLYALEEDEARHGDNPAGAG